MTNQTRRYIVAYDISKDRTRARIAKILKKYGSRAQFSVFLVDLEPAKSLRMQAEIERAIDRSTDSVMVCDLGPIKSLGKKAFVYLGAPIESQPEGPLVF